MTRGASHAQTELAPRASEVSSSAGAAPADSGVALAVREIEQEFITDEGQLVQALGPVSFELKSKEFAALLGPSGCGKSTLFNIVSGVQLPVAGSVVVAGEEVTGQPGVVGYQLQKDLLLDWRTVLDNCILGPEIRGEVSKGVARERARELLERYGLGEFANSYPRQLSGGMRQRAAFIRTLLFERDAILLDEPFGALDAQTRVNMQEWLLDRWEELDKTILLTTHDVEEALFLADTVYVLSSRPGQVTLTLKVDAPRPRRRELLDSAEFIEMKRSALEALHSG